MEVPPPNTIINATCSAGIGDTIINATCSAGIGDTIINATFSDGIREIFYLLSCLDQQYVLFSIATSRQKDHQ